MPKSRKTDLQTLLDSLPMLAQCGVRRVQVGEITIEFGADVSGQPVYVPAPTLPDVDDYPCNVSNKIISDSRSWDKPSNDDDKLTHVNTNDTIGSMEDSLAIATSLDVAHIDD